MSIRKKLNQKKNIRNKSRDTELLVLLIRLIKWTRTRTAVNGSYGEAGGKRHRLDELVKHHHHL